VWQAIQKQKEEGMMRGNAIYRKQPDNVRNQIDLDLEILRNADPTANVDAIANRYGMGAGTPAGSLVKPLEKLFGLEPVEPSTEKVIGKFKTPASATSQGYESELLENGIQRISHDWLRSTKGQPHAQLRAMQDMLEQDDAHREKTGQSLLSITQRRKYEEVIPLLTKQIARNLGDVDGSGLREMQRQDDVNAKAFEIKKRLKNADALPAPKRK